MVGSGSWVDMTPTKIDEWPLKSFFLNVPTIDFQGLCWVSGEYLTDFGDHSFLEKLHGKRHHQKENRMAKQRMIWSFSGLKGYGLEICSFSKALLVSWDRILPALLRCEAAQRGPMCPFLLFDSSGKVSLPHSCFHKSNCIGDLDSKWYGRQELLTTVSVSLRRAVGLEWYC